MPVKILKQKKRLFGLILLEFVLLGMLIFAILYSLFLHVKADENLIQKIDSRYQSFQLADQLRQSSDDLTRMVRLYVSTGDNRFRDYFYQILEIRNGRAPRPENYTYFFWDFKIADKSDLSPSREKSSLRTLMERAGFTEDELKLLTVAEDRSNELVQLEISAIYAMVGRYKDIKGHYTIIGKPDPDFAKNIVFSPEYHQRKFDIMVPIRDVQLSVDKRTAQQLQDDQERVHRVSQLTVLLACLLVVFTPLVFVTILRHQKLSRRDLHESEARFKALHDASFGGVIIHQKGIILDCNQGLTEMTGFTHKELIGMDGLQLIAPGSLETVIENITSGYEARYEVDGVRKDGSLYPLSIKGKNIRYKDSDARVIEFTDMTDTRRAARELQHIEAKHRAILENTSNVVAIIDREGINRFKSPNIKKLFGWDQEDVVNHSTWDNVHPDDLMATQAVFADLLAKENCEIKTECRYRCKDGHYKWIEINALNRFNDPDISGILISYQDISQRKQQNQRFEDIANSIGEWIWEVDARGVFTYCSGKSDNILGLAPEAFIGQTMTRFLPPEKRRAARRSFAKAIRSQTPFKDHENWFMRVDGELVWIATSGVPLFSEDGSFAGFRGVNRDITDRKKLEETQLRSSQLSALGEVVAGVAHEINNPINGVINYSQLLLNKEMARGRQEELFLRIIREGKRIAAIVKNLLHFAQKNDDEKKLCTLKSIVEEPVNLLGKQLLNDGIILDIDIDESLPEIYGNIFQFEQIILNLFSNARHALNERFPTNGPEKKIKVSARQIQRNGSVYLQLRVRDQGCGIPPHHLKKIFNPFFTTKAAGVGTGLGLSVSSEILARHNARINVASEVNNYTEVVIEFPVA